MKGQMVFCFSCTMYRMLKKSVKKVGRVQRLAEIAVSRYDIFNACTRKGQCLSPLLTHPCACDTHVLPVLVLSHSGAPQRRGTKPPGAFSVATLIFY
jgi:hypothetical protein